MPPSEPSTSPRNDLCRDLVIDAIALLGLTLFTCYLLRHVGWYRLPMEDAAMLFRYSRHLAQGQGIVWNVGERPVEGATDFLFMVTIAAVSRLSHHGPILVARVLIALAHLASVALLYISSRRLFGWPIWASLCLALYLALDLAPAYVTAGFGAPFFAFFAMLAWSLALLCMVKGATAARGVGIGFALLATGMVRPEGVLLSGMILVAMLYAMRHESLRAALPAAAVFASLGLAYFARRWHYFGYPLPNPFYLKGGGHLFPDSLRMSIENMVMMLAPTLPFFVLNAFSTERKRTVTALIPTVGFTLIWILLSNENNHVMRFQYGAVPLTLLSIPYISGVLDSRFKWLRPGWVGQTALVLLTIALARAYWKPMTSVAADDASLYSIAIALQPYQDRDYVLAVTEAGLLPYFS
jgi:arabinofuranosyltransferase